jgi:multidrug transporter EmrE-like cation transporter
MNNKNLEMIGWLLLLISVEFVALYSVEKAAITKDNNYLYMTMILHGIPVSLILYKLLEFRKIGTVNFLWNIFSTIGGLFISIYFFQEEISSLQWLGILLGIIGASIVILTGKEII